MNTILPEVVGVELFAAGVLVTNLKMFFGVPCVRNIIERAGIRFPKP